MRSGSSPLARGLPRACPHVLDAARIIPARAGFTAAAPGRRRGRRDHPRSRGVYRRASPLGWRAIGSSPLARGLHDPTTRQRTCPGIIPARAGFTRVVTIHLRRRRDHPRSRGVYPSASEAIRPRCGSSPLARGLRRPTQWENPLRRIIPARAGFTDVVEAVAGGGADHPRSRGVYRSRGFTCSPGRGSSPLARGLPMKTPIPERVGRIIPARAGFTGGEESGSLGGGDHPRSRGVYRIRTRIRGTRAGSSPLARGLPPRGAGGSSAAGSSPLARGLHLRIVGIPTNP